MRSALITRIVQAPTKRSGLLERAAAFRERPGRLDDLCLAGLVATADLLDGIEVSPSHALLLGSALGCAESDYEYYTQVLGRGLKRTNPRLFAYTLPNVVLGEVAIAFGLGGDNLAVTAGRASGLVALGEGAALVSSGQVDAAIVLVLDVVGPGTSRIFDALGTEPVPVATAFLIESHPSVAPIATVHSHSSAFDPDAVLAYPDLDPLGGDGIAQLVAAARRSAACAVEVRCSTGHIARVEVGP